MSSSEILVIILVILLLFGGKRLPELVRTWGRTIIEIRRVFLGIKRDIGLDLMENDVSRNPSPKTNNAEETNRSSSSKDLDDRENNKDMDK